VNAKSKGGRGEREFAALCREQGYSDVCKGQQFKGGIDSPDVRGLPHVHIEVKRTERLNIHNAMAQSVRDSGGQAIPIVAHRRNRDKWMITMLAEDFFTIYREFEAGEALNGSE